MDALVAVSDALTLVLYAVLGVACLRLWMRERDRPAAWAAASFRLLDAVIAVAHVTPEPDDGRLGLWLTKLLLCGLVLFPYLLYRFMTAFSPAGRRLEQVAVGYTLVLLVWSVLLPEIPAEGGPRSTAFQVYVVLFLVHWAAFSSLAASRLWRAGRGQPTVPRRRMRLLSIGAFGLTVALIVAGAGVETAGLELATNLLTAASALLFMGGVVPPELLRMQWRKPEQDRLREAVAGLMRSETESEIAANLLPQLGAVVGAQGVELSGRDGTAVGSWGHVPESSSQTGVRRVAIALAAGELVVWSGPQTPFFGRDELELLRSMGALIDLAFERADLLRRERSTIERLEELDSLKNTFLSAVSHELRTPLAVILGSAVTLNLRRAELAPSDEQALLAALTKSSHKLDSLLTDLLDLDRLARGAASLTRQRADVGELVRRVLGEIDLDGRRPALEFDDVTADVDVPKVERIVSNLVMNALRHTPPYSDICIRVHRDDGAVRVDVEDTGPGVPDELREEIFEPFRRGSAEHTPGTGIGLSLVRRFAELHGGEAWVEERPGGGARFSVRLPQVAA